MSPPRRRARSKRRDSPANKDRQASDLRIIGGEFRGSRLKYSGRLETRPMKDRVREAIFNLVGPDIAGTHALDLFAGTGAIGLEAVSRGAASATFIERHIPTARFIRENIEHLGVSDRCEVITANTFAWARHDLDLPPLPWSIFCSPPYDLYADETDRIVSLIDRLLQAAPARSTFVVEADERFDFALLPAAPQWDVRPYPPAHVGILRKTGET